MIVEREREIEAFNLEEYWSLAADLVGDSKNEFEAKLSKWQGKKAEPK